MLGVHVGLYASCCLFYIKTLLVLYIFLKSFCFIAVGGFRHRSGSSWCLLTLSISLSFSNGLRLSDWFKLHCLNRPDPVTVGQALWEKMQGFCLKCKQLKRKPQNWRVWMRSQRDSTLQVLPHRQSQQRWTTPVNKWWRCHSKMYKLCC